jgi:hypothetical protein
VVPEQLVFLALFLLLGLLNLIVRLFRERAEKPPGGPAPVPPPTPRPAPTPRPVPPRRPAPTLPPPPTLPGPSPAPARAPAARRPATAAPASAPAPPTPPAVPAGTGPVRRSRRASVRLGGPRDLRRAIVLATVLGPCRALEGREPDRERAPARR